MLLPFKPAYALNHTTRADDPLARAPKAGEAMGGWRITAQITITPTIGSRGRDLFGTFTVLPGQTADLGRTVVTPLNKVTIMGRSALHTDNRQLLARKSPPHARLLGQNAAPGWITPRQDGDVAEAIALRRPVGAGCLRARQDVRGAYISKDQCLSWQQVPTPRNAWVPLQAGGMGFWVQDRCRIGRVATETDARRAGMFHFS